MKFRHIHFIINPASEKGVPVLFYIHQAFIGSDSKWDMSVTHAYRNAADIARSLIGKTDLIAVYGGDGCVTSVARALHGTSTPMAIIPGGTANVMAHELDLPMETRAAIEMLLNDKCQIKAIDMGTMNGQPFLLRVNLGIMADMVLQADRKFKNYIGRLAYFIAGIKTIANAQPIAYNLEIDGIEINETAYSLTITNSGNIGISNLMMQPGISVTDGWLDIILLKSNSLSTLLKLTGATLLQSKTDAIMHWKCKKVVIKLKEKQAFICDDYKEIADEINIELVPASINMVVPAI